MFDNKTRLAVLTVLVLLLLLAVTLSIRGAGRATPAPTVSLADVQTAAVATFRAGLTRTAEALPTASSTRTPAPSDTPAGTAVSPTPSCYKLHYVRDVTVPDYTVMIPGLIFTKTWEVENTGTCAWLPGFEFALIGGNAMGGEPLTLTETINAGQRIRLSIDMAAPADGTGIVVGTWRMSDENGIPFGDALTVIIDLGGITGTPATATATATP
jgi:Ig-like domain-containing protein